VVRNSVQSTPSSPSARRSAAAVALLALAVFVALSLISFDSHDPPDPDFPANNQPANACGLVGAYVAKTLLVYLGIGSYLLAGMGCFWAYMVAGRRSHGHAFLTCVAGAAAIVSASTLVAVLAETPAFQWLAATRLPSPGGLVGAYVAFTLLQLLALPGTLLLLGTAVLVTAILATEMMLVRALAAVGGAVLGGLGRLGQLWTERRKALLLTRAMASAKERRRKLVVVGQEEGPDIPVVSRAAAELDRAFEAATQSAPESRSSALAAGKGPAPAPGRGATARGRAETDGRPGGAGTDYELPGIDLLDEPEEVDLSLQEEAIQDKAHILERCLAEFSVSVEVVNIRTGPVITQYELALAPGTKVGKVLALRDDIAMALKSTSVRILAPIPGRGTVGVEVPNVQKTLVRIRQLMEEAPVPEMQIPLFLGKDVSGHPVVSDLAEMPHLLIAGCTGSGKSVCINTLIVSMLMALSPRQLKFLLVDPKMVELSGFRDLPHLLAPLVTDMKKAAGILAWAERTMDERYELLAQAEVRNISAFNKLTEDEVRRRLKVEDPDVRAEDIPYPLPYIVIIIDELADLMMLNRTGEVETSITRLAQKSRAVGIHVIFATQRPSVDVVTGLIKANLPARISFQVSSKVDSRTILDQNGAEKLLGKGDMLFLPPQSAKLIRAQGTFVSDEEVNRVVEFVCRRARPDFSHELVQLPESGQGSTPASNSERDELYDDAVRIVVASGRGSVSLLQRRLEIGYTRAARLVDMMAEDGIVGEYKEGKARDVVLGEDQLDSFLQFRQQSES